MKRLIILFIVLFAALALSACNTLKLGIAAINSPLENELKRAGKIVFVNSKESTLKFTVADPKAIEQIASVISTIKPVDGMTDVMPDYTITFYLPNGEKKIFSYWMGASENDKEINIMDQGGMYYRIAGSLDVYIINSTKMWLRPKYFTDLYSACLSEGISRLEKDKDKEVIVGVDITSDRRMRKYTMSYEDEKLFNGISAEGYTIVPWSEEGKFTYKVSFVTNIYNPDKAKITIEAIKVAGKTKQTYVAEAVLENDTDWLIKINQKNLKDEE